MKVMPYLTGIKIRLHDMNIPKYQWGGGFESLFTIYGPAQTQTPRRAADLVRESKSRKRDDSDDSDKGELTEKDLFSMLKELDGLPNEIQDLVSTLTNTLKIARITGPDDLTDLSSIYLATLTKLKYAKYNRDLFKETYKRAVENDSLNDIAITLDGNVLALDKDQKIVLMKPEEWVQAKQTGEYQALTNSNLLWYRSHHPRYVNNNKILQIVENGIGLDTVHTMIKDRFNRLGKTETSSETYISKEAAQGKQILEQMLQLGPEGYYKISTDLTQTDQRQVDATLDYIYSTLPPNARTRLALETTDGSRESARNVIGAMVFGTLDSKTKYSTQYIGTEEKLSGNGKKGFDNNIKMNTAMKWLAGYGNKESFIVNMGSSGSYLVQANTMPLVKMNNNYLGVNSTLQQVSEGQYSSILDLRSVSMGMKLIDPSAFSQILLSDGKISSIDFPCVEQNGVVMPDLSQQTRVKKEKADALIRQRGINLTDPNSIRQNYATINQIYQDNGLPAAYNADGTLITAGWRRFGVINGKASNKALGMGQFDSNSLLQEDNDDNSVQNYIDITKDENWDTNNFLWNGVDHLYKGTIWIPVQVNYHSAAANIKMSANEAQQLEQRQQALDMQNQYTKPPQI